EGGCVETVRVLLNAETDVNKVGDGGTPLQRASRKGCIGIVKLLIAARADVDKDNASTAAMDQETALAAAASGGFTDIAQLLLQSRADINKPCKHEDFSPVRSPLAAACIDGHIDIVRQLLDARADANSPEAFYALPNRHSPFDPPRFLTPLGAACMGSDENSTEIVQLLLAAGADTDAPSAIPAGSLSLRQGSNIFSIPETPNACDPRVESHARPLAAASQFGVLHVVQLLLEVRADKDALSDGGTALRMAARKGHAEIVRLLLRAGADRNKPCLEGTHRTPLEAAAFYGRAEAYNLLSGEE
ncbi:mask, partial [Symbiodinium pilosum]